jgi:diguanylate cyclase (GGDEF)-like protein
MPRRHAYAVLAALLAAGAPLGLLLLRRATAEDALVSVSRILRADPQTFLYVSVSTVIVFSLFGYVLGRQTDALIELSHTDPLTGLHNHRGFTERLTDEVARATRYDSPLSLLLVDVDRLKDINDRSGHHGGDAALRLVADALRDDARQTDLAARVGGDEFAIIAPSTGREDAVALAERVRGLVAARGTGDALSVSIGVGTLDPAHATPPELERAADAALYEAKRRGRNQVAAGVAPSAMSPPSQAGPESGTSKE